MRLAYRRKCIANMCAVNAENGSIFVSAASVMLELDWLRHNVKVRCLLRTPTTER